MAARRPKVDPTASALADRIARAKASTPPRDPTGVHHAAICEIAKRIGKDPCTLLDEWEERAAVREYTGNMTRAEAEARAVDDIKALNFKQTEIAA